MATTVSLKTKILMGLGFVAFVGGPLAVWWLAGGPPTSIQDQCAAHCKGRGYTLVRKDAPMTAHGNHQYECRCAT